MEAKQQWQAAILPVKQKYAVRFIRKYGTKPTVWSVDCDNEWRNVEALAAWLIGENSTRSATLHGRADEAAQMVDRLLGEMV